ncbi:MAG TPA: hypothetical protein VFQ40_04225 [Actinomycetota bacterium]|nr:hypothetical protein [Actinomycetota bacterium]
MPTTRRCRYRVELTACFEVTIDEVIDAPAGLGRAALEEVIDRTWWWISGATDVLFDSSWKLEGFEELPSETD